MVAIINTCTEASCSAVADILGGFFGSGLIGTFIEPFFGEAPCGPVTFAEVCGTLIGK